MSIESYYSELPDRVKRFTAVGLTALSMIGLVVATNKYSEVDKRQGELVTYNINGQNYTLEFVGDKTVTADLLNNPSALAGQVENADELPSLEPVEDYIYEKNKDGALGNQIIIPDAVYIYEIAAKK
jgi:hypothetical protein